MTAGGAGLLRVFIPQPTLLRPIPSIGVYGVMAYTVSRRAPEIAVRMALGATRRDVALLVLGRGMLLAGMGLLAGGAAAAGLARALQSMLPEIGAFDPVSFTVSTAILVIAALSACAIPALRAIKLDPIAVLRQG